MQGSTRQARAGHYRFRLTRPRGSDGLRPLPVPQRGSRTALIDDGGVAWMVATALVAGEGRAHPGPPPPPPIRGRVSHQFGNDRGDRKAEPLDSGDEVASQPLRHTPGQRRDDDLVKAALLD